MCDYDGKKEYQDMLDKYYGGDRANQIKSWIDARAAEGQKPHKVIFYITTPKFMTDKYTNETMLKVKELFEKYDVKSGFVDTVSGAFNLNRDWLETETPVDCYVEYCGVYPINWDMADVKELERMDTDGEIIIIADWIEGDKRVPNH